MRRRVSCLKKRRTSWRCRARGVARNGTVVLCVEALRKRKRTRNLYDQHRSADGKVPITMIPQGLRDGVEDLLRLSLRPGNPTTQRQRKKRHPSQGFVGSLQ